MANEIFEEYDGDFVSQDKEGKVTLKYVFGKEVALLNEQMNKPKSEVAEHMIKKTSPKTLKMLRDLNTMVENVRELADGAAKKLTEQNQNKSNLSVLRYAGNNLLKLQNWRSKLKKIYENQEEFYELQLQIDRLKEERKGASKAQKQIKKEEEKRLNESMKQLKKSYKKLEYFITYFGKVLKKSKSNARLVGTTSVKNLDGILQHIQDKILPEDVLYALLYEGDKNKGKLNSDRIELSTYKLIAKCQMRSSEVKSRTKQLESICNGTLKINDNDNVEEQYINAEILGLVKELYKAAFSNVDRIVALAGMKSKNGGDELKKETEIFRKGVKKVPDIIQARKKLWMKKKGDKKGLSKDLIHLMMIAVGAKLIDQIDVDKILVAVKKSGTPLPGRILMLAMLSTVGSVLYKVGTSVVSFIAVVVAIPTALLLAIPTLMGIGMVLAVENIQIAIEKGKEKKEQKKKEKQKNSTSTVLS